MQNMLAFAQALRAQGAGLRMLNLGGGDGARCSAALFFDVKACTSDGQLQVPQLEPGPVCSTP